MYVFAAEVDFDDAALLADLQHEHDSRVAIGLGPCGPELRIRMDATSIDAALATGMHLLRDWELGDVARAIRVVPADEVEADRDVMGTTDIAGLLDLTPQTVTSAVGRPDFPEPWATPRRGNLFLRSHVEHWIRTAHRRGPGRPPRSLGELQAECGKLNLEEDEILEKLKDDNSDELTARLTKIRYRARVLDRRIQAMMSKNRGIDGT